MLMFVHFRNALLSLSLLHVSAGVALCQQKPAAEPEQGDDVVRVKSELVQTDVMVLDGNGLFVEGLKPEQFVLKIDGKIQPVAFFDRVVAGSVNEEAQLAAARGVQRSTTGTMAVTVSPMGRGRTIVFFMDDLHMAFDSIKRTRDAITHYIDAEMGQNDQAAITSAAGRIGFLQQVTDEKAVLKAAVQRLSYKPYSVSDHQQPAMSEYQALKISRRDIDIRGFFVDEFIRQNPGTSRESAEAVVDERARSMLQIAASITKSLLTSVLGTIKNLGKVPGSKLLFMVSDGFFLDTENSDTVEMIRRVTDQSRRSHVLIYTIDSRGLVSGMPDASMEVAFDPTNRLSRGGMGEVTASQDGMNALAVDTGGKALRNSNDLRSQVGTSIKETSNYYLLAWQPLSHEQKSPKFRRIEVSIAGRPELSVRVRRGFFESEPAPPKKVTNPTINPVTPKTDEIALREAVVDLLPETAIQMNLGVNYLDLAGRGPTLSGLMEIDPNSLSFTNLEGKQVASLDIIGVIYDEQGKPFRTLKDHLNYSPAAPQNGNKIARGPMYGFQAPVKPGLYQIRVAVLDRKSKQMGSARQWVDVPDLSKGKLAMSSVLIGESYRAAEKASDGAGSGALLTGSAPEALATKRFESSSFLTFMTYVYNPKTGPSPEKGKPDVVLQVQIFRDNQPVMTTALRKVSTEGVEDLSKLPYAAETSLKGLPSGQYALKITAIDRIAKKSVSQQANFSIE
jgi:VWFA-related protein